MGFSSPFVVQVGAYDGVANDLLNDYIRRFKLSGLLIEPQHDAFARLRLSYADQDQLSLCQAAIAEQDGIRNLYSIDPCASGLPEWAGQTATFLKEVLVKHRHAIRDIERHIITRQVACRTFNSLFEEYKIKKVDILQIDAEGYDYEALKLFPFDQFNPILVRYEHHHLSTEDQDASLRFLADRGYSLFVADRNCDYMNTIAYRPKFLVD
jgi:FkbM family methyltransferase